jgi:hypothetical protein
VNYALQHHAYCGMSEYPTGFCSMREARRGVAECLRGYRRHFTVRTLERGLRWEILDPTTSVTVPEECGILTLSFRTFECPKCGHVYRDAGDASACCSEEFADVIAWGRS